MPTISETKESLRKSAIDAYRDEYKEYANFWRNLEAKAQGNITVTGIFIGGIFVLITKSESRISEPERFFLLLSIGLLFLSVIFSVLVLKTRNIPAPPLGSFMDYSVKRLLEVEDADFHERVRRFNNDYFNKWQGVTTQMVKALRLKASRLWAAQILLMVAILTVSMLAAVRIIFLMP